ncbi:hypothetical protein CTI12_AA290410 [Artemisia annua]|uniref:RRM domain-containing protein n=1 Tax=Artemisia annua TaxID=35608 RepID=A0A2U1NAE8_ARTAN|nr:hypothetical protein CTI12_AA290410 [Artemisia annua]
MLMNRENKDTNGKLAKPVMKLYTEMWNSQYADRDFSLCQAKELLDHLESVLANEPFSVKSGQDIVEVIPQPKLLLTIRSRGFAFVSYTSADATNTTLQDTEGKELHGRRIRVNLAQERPRPSFGGGAYGGIRPSKDHP